jgi:hypothetical protein
MNEERKRTSFEVAEILSIKRTSLMSTLARRPELRPAERIQPSGDFLWSQAEVDRLLASRRRPGRPPKSRCTTKPNSATVTQSESG